MNRGDRRTPAGRTLSIGYVAQAYSAIASLAFAPYILKTIGPEAYGLVGVFLIAQGWLQLLDAGLTPTTTRETARYWGNAVSGKSLANTVKGLELVILLVAFPLMGIAWSFTDNIASNWLQREALSVQEITLAFNIMIVMFTIRWASGVRRGVLLGSEKHTYIYVITLCVSTLRYPCIVVFFTIVDPTSTHYFLYQLGISCFEMLMLGLLTRTLVPRHLADGAVAAVKSLRKISAFALNHSYLALIWILITQTDKLLLSKALSLGQYGQFTLAIAAAAGVRLIAQPIGQILKPRLARLYAASETISLIDTFRLGTRFAVVTLSGLTATFLFFGHEVMYSWTGDLAIAQATGQVLSFYSLGNSVLLMGTFTYYLQFASGDLSMHRIGSTAMLLLILPVMYFAAVNDGMVGTAKAWSIVWIVYLCTWITLSNRKFLRGQHYLWLGRDIVGTFIPALIVAALTNHWLAMSPERLVLSAQLGSVIVVCTFASLLFSGLPTYIWNKRIRNENNKC